MSYDVTFGKGIITIYFPAREPINLWERNEALHLIVDLCEAFKKAFPDDARQTPK